MLPAWQLYCDHIIVADQRSTDGSSEFLARTANVTRVINNDLEFNETNRIKLMVAKARHILSSPILLFLDADETLSANILFSLEWKSFVKSEPGTTGYFRWVQLYGSVKRYIARGKTGIPVHMPFAFVDDGRDFDDGTLMHGPRGPGLSNPTRAFFFNDVVNLHFFLTNRIIFKKKQNWYKLYWLKKGGRYFHINRNHATYESISLKETEASPIEWYEGFQKNQIDIFSAENPALTWYDIEILNFMNANGTRSLWLLDIWNQDWEKLRKLANELGVPDIPGKPITPPPKIVRMYNDTVLGRINAREAMRSVSRFLTRSILP
jgi:hypothetical protein